MSPCRDHITIVSAHDAVVSEIGGLLFAMAQAEEIAIDIGIVHIDQCNARVAIAFPEPFELPFFLEVHSCDWRQLLFPLNDNYWDA